MTKKTILNVTAVVMILLAVATLLPTGTAHKANALGYISLCSYSPISSIILFAIAVLALFVAKKSIEE